MAPTMEEANRDAGPQRRLPSLRALKFVFAGVLAVAAVGALVADPGRRPFVPIAILVILGVWLCNERNREPSPGGMTGTDLLILLVLVVVIGALFGSWLLKIP